MSAWFFIILSLILLILYIYKSLRNVHEFFERSGIPFVKPCFIFGEEIDMILNRKPLSKKYEELHRKLGGCRIGGAIFSCKPAFIIRDPELFNTMMTKDYTYFEAANLVKTNTVHPIEKQMLINLRGNEWKVRRQKTIPFFSNKSLKLMLRMMEKTMDKLIPFFDKLSNKEYVLVKEISLRTITDLSTCILFGNEKSWLEDPNSKNFKLINDLCYVRKSIIFHVAFPDMSKLLIKLGLGLYKYTFHNENNIETIKSIILNKLLHRENNAVQQNDYLNFLMESKIKQSEKSVNDGIMSDNFIVASVLQLLSTNLLATTTTLNVCLAELSMNQKVQDKLRREIKKVLGLCNEEKLSFEVLNKMAYLNMIISESLRLLPTFNRKQCFQDYRIPNTDVVIPKGSFVTLSVESIHMDEKYYEKPKEFYPEHFTNEAKAKRPKWAFVPFGFGPKNCIGNRLVYLQLKIALVYVIKNFKLEVSPKVEKPIDKRRIYRTMLTENPYSHEIIFRKI